MRARASIRPFQLLIIALLSALIASCAPAAPPVATTTAAPAPAAPTSTTVPTGAVPTATLAPAPTGAAEWTPAARTKTSGCQSRLGRPDAACTPGAADPRVNQADIGTTICVPGYSRSVRPPETVTEKIKREQMAAYGLEGQRLADFELDHLVSLELGGAPQDIANLWPESWNGDANAHQKDSVENFLHEQVCRGAVALAEAQREIATDWLGVYTSRRLAPAISATD